MKRIWFLAPVFGVSLMAATPAALADTIRHPVGVFAGLDKITGRIITFDVAIDETVQFGTLQITPRVCLSRPQTEAPLTEGFVEIDEIETSKQAKRIFSGWMFAASPGLNGVEHPVYDVWLKDCKGGAEITRAPAAAAPDVNTPPPPNATPASGPAKKPRRTITPRNPDEPSMDSLPPSGDPQLNPPPAQSPIDRDPAAVAPSDLGAPVEVGSAPKPKKPKRKPPQNPSVMPPEGAFQPPLQRRVPPASQHEPLAPMLPGDLPRDSFFR